SARRLRGADTERARRGRPLPRRDRLRGAVGVPAEPSARQTRLQIGLFPVEPAARVRSRQRVAAPWLTFSAPVEPLPRHARPAPPARARARPPARRRRPVPPPPGAAPPPTAGAPAAARHKPRNRGPPWTARPPPPRGGLSSSGPRRGGAIFPFWGGAPAV